MIRQQEMPQPPTDAGHGFPWLRVLLGLLVGVGIMWLAVRQVNLAEVGQAILHAHLTYIFLGLAVILLTMLAKAWRWQLLYYPTTPPPSLPGLFWAMTLGQFVNLVIRLGEVARIYALEQDTAGVKARSLGTLVLEKTLDSLMLALTIALALPFVVLPAFVTNYVPSLLIITSLAALGLTLIAYRAEWVLRLFEWGMRFVPASLRDRFMRRLMRLVGSGLLGLSALRSHRQTLVLVLLSAFIAFLGILTPLILFPALGLPFGLLEATLLHTILSIGLTPPSTPAKVGVFEWLTIWILGLVGLRDEALALSYGLIYHAVVILPQTVLGIIAAARLDWRQIFHARSRPHTPPPNPEN